MTIRMISPVVSRLLPLAAAILLAGSAPVAAQQDNEQSMMQIMLNKIGLIEAPKDSIDYRERAPLVVPPSTELISPRALDDIRNSNPDWPVDADQKRRRQPTEADKFQAKLEDEAFHAGRPLTPEELRRGTISRNEANRRSKNSGSVTASSERERLTPDELGFKGWFSKKEEQRVVFSGEPERTSLTQPPPGYLTPSPNAPYGLVEKRKDDYKASTLMDRAGSVDDRR